MRADDLMPTLEWIEERQQITKSLYKHFKKAFNKNDKGLTNVIIDEIISLVAKDMNKDTGSISRFLLVDSIMNNVMLECN